MQSVITLQPRGEMSTAWWISVAAMWMVMVTTVGGNLAVLMALRRVDRAPAHYPLMSLASADLLVGLLVLPLAGARELFAFNLDGIICSFWNTLDVLCCTASILSICLLGWERWCGITAPLARARRAHQARLYAGLVWPISIAVALPTAFIPSYKSHIPGEIPKACTVNTNVGYVFFSTALSFYIPASVMVFLYGRILRALATPPAIRAHRGRSPYHERPDMSNTNLNKDLYKLATPEKGSKTQVNIPMLKPLNDDGFDLQSLSPTKSQKNYQECKTNEALKQSIENGKKQRPSSPKYPVTSSSKNPASRNIVSRQRRATRTIVMLMSLFLFCWTPFFVMLPVDSLCGCVHDKTWQWCSWLGYANSALNPLVYAASSPTVGRALQESFTSTTCTKSGE